MSGPLSGIKIIDLSSVISGPVATVLLADQGADVIKVEAPQGDIIRRMGLGKNNLSPGFVSANRGKRSICIDLKEPAGVTIVKKLIADADVFIQNFRPGAIERMGLSYDVMSALNPRLLYVSVSGFGETGPYAHKRVYDPVIQALTGLPDVQADSATSRPKMVRTIIPDKVSALTTAQAITAGLLERERGSGEGQHIKVAMIDATISFLWPEALGGLTMVGGEKNVRRGQLAQDLIFETKDGYITCGAVSDSEWKGMCAALEQPHWLEDERFSTPMGRVANAKERIDSMGDVLKSRSSADWLERLDANDVPCAPVLSRPEILENEQIKANKLISQYEHPGLGQIRQPRPGAKFSRSDMRKEPIAPALGQHSEEILRDLGLPGAAIRELVDKGIVMTSSGDKA
ncbi:MAG: CoA transferase [Gammaproteobacteria bacterium]|nr:CoA transferase [Gammaproteobacteria bacterium]MBT3870944.1 CoA transferase [Gammaproteobacteria bacterium]MBT4618805.1 CoA transferase [Gammaproteobacteria bacterium]MBT5198060.1 CoA transferase [Gammaproteobacteria bacterium]MBT5442002.1 CoA transferase [Gammaproteobacteria bacterium]